MEWKQTSRLANILSVARLGNFLSGMETLTKMIRCTALLLLGNFLSGMETEVQEKFPIGYGGYLGNFLSGMETVSFIILP